MWAPTDTEVVGDDRRDEQEQHAGHDGTHVRRRDRPSGDRRRYEVEHGEDHESFVNIAPPPEIDGASYEGREQHDVREQDEQEYQRVGPIGAATASEAYGEPRSREDHGCAD